MKASGVEAPSTADEVLLGKAAIIERCLARVAEEVEAAGSALASDLTRQDAALLNLLRACEAAIDGAMRKVRKAGCGIPRDAREAFTLLQHARLLPDELTLAMVRMEGFRNVSVHDYQDLDPKVTYEVLVHHHQDLAAFARWLVAEGTDLQAGERAGRLGYRVYSFSA
ncbi:MAG: DUF86 domain-containing protein [Candidatus Sericytochromatia bacterium]|nr:DUF86 domain-containing protein [Candidatus Sericytochromatia bacterium]